MTTEKGDGTTALSRARDLGFRWEAERAAAEAATHQAIGVVIGAYTRAIDHHTARGAVALVEDLTAGRQAAARLRSTVHETTTADLGAVVAALRATAARLREGLG